MTHLLGQLFSYLVTSAIVWIAYRGARFDRGLKYRTFWPRFWCGSIDSCVLWPTTAVVFLVATLSPPTAAIAALLVVQQMIFWTYTVGMHARYGQTVGKMFTGVRVVDATTEAAITFSQALLRESIPIIMQAFALFWEIRLALTNPTLALTFLRGEQVKAANLGFALALLIPGIWFVAEVLTMLSNDKRRALHDYIAGTVVIRTRLESTAENSDLLASPSA